MGSRLALAGAVALVCGCYEPNFASCAVTCASAQGCPSGLSCISGFCLEPGSSAAACESSGSDGGSPDGPGADGPPAGEMVAIAAGTFTMGCTAGVDPGCDTDESPAHSVTLSAFEIDATEVRQTDYLDCVVASACDEPADDPNLGGLEWNPSVTPNHPVFHVTWNMAFAYCAFAGKRLPTEAEWERAARGAQGRTYPWGEEPPECFRAHHRDCTAVDLPVPVASSNAGRTPEGVFDMAGNVFEWVNDWYAPDYYSLSDGETDPQGPAQFDDRKVGRSGGFLTNGDEFLRGAFRSSFPFDNDPNTYGFRCARSL